MEGGEGRPQEKWQDEIVENGGNIWTEKAEDREKWLQLEEAYPRGNLGK